jgi:hypothetical protein
MNANLQTVDVVIPVFNEELSLAHNVDLLIAFLREEFPFSFGIVIAAGARADRSRVTSGRRRLRRPSPTSCSGRSS